MTPFDRAADAHHLDDLAERCAFAVRDEARPSLLHYCELVAQWGARTDLVAARTPEALVEILCLDALMLAQGISQGHSVVDIGAGAGAPAISAAILRPDLRFTLVEPRRKRVAFMRTAVGALGLSERVDVREGRLADLGDERFDTAMSRATFDPPLWLEHGQALAAQVAVFLGAGPVPTGTVRWQIHYLTGKGGSRSVLLYE